MPEIEKKIRTALRAETIGSAPLRRAETGRVMTAEPIGGDAANCAQARAEPVRTRDAYLIAQTESREAALANLRALASSPAHAPTSRSVAPDEVDRHLLTAGAEWLEGCAANTGDTRFALAAGILRGKRPGRRASNDRAQLAEMAIEIEHNPLLTVEGAAKLVALTCEDKHSLGATTRRLARKYRATKPAQN